MKKQVRGCCGMCLLSELLGFLLFIYLYSICICKQCDDESLCRIVARVVIRFVGKFEKEKQRNCH